MGKAFHEFVHNEPLMTAGIAWVVAASLKFITELIRTRRIDWERLVGTGGMPSTHTTPVVACALSLGLVAGFDSPVFAIALILAIVVAYDASGIRRHAGEQAKAINSLIQDLFGGMFHKEYKPADFFKRWDLKEMQTLLGHEPIEVFAGVVVGIITALVVHFRYGYLFEQ